MNRRLLSLAASAFLALTVACAGTVGWAAPVNGRVTKDEFFIISSLNLQKDEMVLKMPTEVTMQMLVTDKTSIVDEHGKHIRIADLRAGDTAYITYAQHGGEAEALSIRLGPMTVQELRRRYLHEERTPGATPTTVPGVHPQTAQVGLSRA